MRTAWTRLIRTLPLLAALLTLAAPAPAQAATACIGTPGQVTFGAVTVNDKLVVPAGAVCELDGTTVTGSVEVEPGASLTLRNAEVRGEVEAEGHELLVIDESEIRGGVEATEGGPAVIADSRIGDSVELTGNRIELTLVVDKSTIRGHLTVEENQVIGQEINGQLIGEIHLRYNTVGGAMTVDDNSSITLFNVGGNAVGGSLECAGNSPAPSDFGVPNEARGGKDGQCASL